MTTDSSTGGYLAPSGVIAPTEGADLDLQLQAAVVGITGLDGAYVRPRWQATSPKQPEASVNWCAISVTEINPDDGAYIKHRSGILENDDYVRHEGIEVLVSFYGTSSQSYASILRDGIAIPQNMEALNAVGIYFKECGSIRSVPELINQQWIKRVDMTVSLRRKVKRTYSVLNILSAAPILVSDDIGIITN